MKLNKFTFILLFSISSSNAIYGTCISKPECSSVYFAEQDTLENIQILYNGIYWRNHYYRIKEDQYLFSKEFLRGSLSISGKSFKNLDIRYDIYNDEIMIPTNYGAIVQLNKEMVDSFTIDFKGKTYRFNKVAADSIRGFAGYVNVLYNGNNSFYVKYKKQIELLAIDRKYDMFYQTHRIFFMKDNVVYPIGGKGDLLKVMNDKNAEIKTFIKKSKLKVSKKNPESFVPIVRYYDSIIH